MYFRTSMGTFRLALLAAMGVGASTWTACSGSFREGIPQPDGLDGGPGGSGVGGGSLGGSSSGGAGSSSSGGRSMGGSSTGGGPSSTGGSSSGGANAGGAPPVCLNPKPLAGSSGAVGPSGGFVQCEGGMVHRPSVGDCWSALDPLDASVPRPTGPDGSVKIDCRTNGDCTAAPHGYCMTDWGFGQIGPMGVTCHYGCIRDSECAAEELCLCGDPVGTCVAAHCKTDRDCPAGVPCMEGWTNSGCGPTTIQFTCGPLCRTDADCPQTGGIGSMMCSQGNCTSNVVCGRPFLVQGAARLALPEARDDWAFAMTPDASDLPADARRALAQHYTEVGSMEHASVAAFARFSLQLLGLGAPPELVSLATDALRDETRHARICFGLASAYGGAGVGPGPLPLGGVLATGSLEEQIRTAFLEACIGETLAAVEVAEAAEQASDPVVVGILRRIAEDETRHAALGFQFVKWALARMDSERRAALATELFAAARGLGGTDEAAEPKGAHEALLVRHGLLPARVRRALREAAMRDAVLPCVRELLMCGSRSLLAA